MKTKKSAGKDVERKILTPKGAASLCGVHPATIVRWVGEGKLKAFRTLGGHRRIQFKDVQDLMARCGIPA